MFDIWNAMGECGASVRHCLCLASVHAGHESTYKLDKMCHSNVMQFSVIDVCACATMECDTCDTCATNFDSNW